jgi:hypothetical protein
MNVDFVSGDTTSRMLYWRHETLLSNDRKGPQSL